MKCQPELKDDFVTDIHEVTIEITAGKPKQQLASLLEDPTQPTLPRNIQITI